MISLESSQSSEKDANYLNSGIGTRAAGNYPPKAHNEEKRHLQLPLLFLLSFPEGICFRASPERSHPECYYVFFS